MVMSVTGTRLEMYSSTMMCRTAMRRSPSGISGHEPPAKLLMSVCPHRSPPAWVRNPYMNASARCPSSLPPCVL